MLVGKVVYLRLGADFFNRQGCRLRPDHAPVLQENDLNLVFAGRHVSGQLEPGLEQALTKKGHTADLGAVETLRLVVSDQSRAPLLRHVGGGLGPGQLQAQVVQTHLMARQHGRGRDFGERPGAGDGIEAGRSLEGHLCRVDPNSQHPALAMDHQRTVRSAHDDHDIALALGRAEQQHVGAGKTGGDCDQVAREVGDQGVRLRGAGRRQQTDGHQAEECGSLSHRTTPIE